MNTLLNTPATNDAVDKRALLAERLRQAAETPATPLSFAQQRLWFIDQLEPNSPLYNIPIVARITGAVCLPSLQEALNTLVSRHEILRTRFVCVDESPAQIVDHEVSTQIGMHDLSALPAVEREAAALRFVREEANRPFKLSSEAPFRAAMLRLAAEEHWFILNMHHIVSDEWSVKLCFRELGELYGAYCRGTTPALPELGIQYSDFALWQQEWMQGSVLERQLRYWREQLGGNPPVLEVPADRPRPAVPSFRGSSQAHALDSDLSVALKQLAVRQDATLFMVLLAAFKALLYRYTEQEDIVVGSPIAGRNRVETEQLIGFFVNTLALRTRLEGDPTFEQALARVREVTLGAYAHQDLSFERLVAELKPERTLDHMPFTRVMFAVQNQALETVQWPGLTIRFLDVESETAKFDLTLFVQDKEDGLMARIEYSTDLFDAPTITRLLRHFENILRAVVANPQQRLSQLPMLARSERRQVIVDWNGGSTEYPRSRCVHELFEEQAVRTPDAIAAMYGRNTITYQQLNERANQVARILKKFVNRPDVLVGLCMERSIEMVVGMLAILKAGAAYAPLDPAYPAERLEFMLNDSRAPVVLTQQGLLARIPRSGARLLCIDSDWELFARESRQNLPGAADAESLAYVIYTSGSTGTPKGVAVPHRGINRLVLNTDYIRLGPADRVAQASNASFDAATFEIWGALLNGACIVGITRDVMLSPQDFAGELRERKISVLFLTTALFNQLASEAPGAFASLRAVLFGGENVDPTSVRAVLRDGPPRELLHVYGPTENTTFSTWHRVLQVSADAATVPIGRAVANTQCYVLDAHLNPVPAGVPGELYLGGDGLARGYWNRPELTAQKFVPNPFADEPSPAQSSVLYRSGDLVRWRADGALEFIGRIDQQVKIRGFRVELGEIESILGRHPCVRECVVTVHQNGSAHKRLAAYFVPAEHRVPGADELRRMLQEKLPDYMVPSAYVPLAALPLTGNGKVDRRALPAPDKVRSDLEKQHVAPRDEVEAKLCRIWENVLGVHPVGVEDKFFDLGGHSLLAVRVNAQIEKTFGKALRLATLFQAPTVEQLAAILREEARENTVTVGSSIVEIQARGTGAPLFLVHGAGGGMFWGYVNLARHLGTSRPIYGLKSRGLDDGEEFATIEEMARHYVADVRSVQPAGPYYLGGFCFGGNVAYEIARQLRAEGEEVALLALFNCAPPNSGYGQVQWHRPEWLLRFARNLVYWGGYFLGWTPAQRREFFRWKGRLARHRLARFFGGAKNNTAEVDVVSLVDTSSYSPPQRKLWEAHIRALINYHPQPYDGPVHLFRSPGHPVLCSFAPDYGWGELVRGGVTVTVVPGAHETILEEPSAQSLAAELSKCLNGTPRPEAGSPSKGRLALLRGAMVRASLFWLGAEGEWLLTQSPGMGGGGLALAMLFHHLDGLSHTGKDAAPDDAFRNGSNDNGKRIGAVPETHSSPDAAENRVEQIEIPQPLGQALRSLSAAEGVELHVTLLAASRVLLHRHWPGGDYSVSALLSAPAPDALGNMIQSRVSEPVMRTDLSSEPAFRELLRRMRDAVRESGGEVEAQDAASHEPVSRAARLSVQFHLAGTELPGVAEFGGECRLNFSFPEPHKGFAAELEYHPGVFDGVSASRMLGHLQMLLESVAANPDEAISKLPMLTPSERRQLLVEWNDTRAEFPVDTTYHAQFAAQVDRTPDALAVRHLEVELTYAELNRRANRLANYLKTLGVGPDVLVGVCVERSPELMIALLAVLKAGGAYLPLDPAYPKERLAYMLADSDTRVLLTQIKFLSDFSTGQAKIVCLDDPHQQSRIARCEETNPPQSATAGDLAYVIYTSGSTGTPKGVQITHRSMLNHNFAVARAYGLQPADRVLQFTPISFDISVEEIFPSWLSGCAVVLRTDEALSSVARFAQFVTDERLTVLNLPTAYWHELVEFTQQQPMPPSMRLIVIGGEKASDEAYRRWKKRVDGVTLINTYGPTETTVITSLYVGRAEEDTLPIGRPIANTQVLILDPHMQPVPVGVAGELHIGGAGLSRGYLNRPELTAERFVPNPFQAEIPSERLYKTGDLARFRADGCIEFLGRLDQQVKIRGFRIELGEVEAALAAHPAIKDAAVIAREDTPGQKRLVAYFVPRKSAHPGVSDLLQFLKRKLPGYMVPSAFVQLESLPLTPAGKVDRKSLPPPGTARPELEQHFVGPRTPLEEVLAGIWSEVLGLNRVGVHDNFFDLGGHSLLAIQVITRMRDTLQVDIPLGNLFALPTVESLAAQLADVSNQTQPVLPLSAVAKGEVLPLTPAQRRIWFLDQFDPQQAAYNIPTALRISGKLDVPALERSIGELIRRHDALRAIFPTENGQPVQHISEPKEFALPVTDLSDVPEAEREQRAISFAEQEARRPYFMASAVFRPMLLRLGDTQHVLLFTTHEIASDDASVRVLLDELAELYDGFAAGGAPGLAPLPVRYADAFAGARLSPETEMEKLHYWKRQLEGAPALLELPSDFPRSALRGDRGARQPLKLPRSVVDALERLSDEEGCTLFMTLLAVFQTLLSRYTGSDDIVVGSSLSTRTRAEIERVVGRFTNLVALRCDLSGDPEFRQLLDRVHNVVLGAMEHRTLPFERIVDELQPPRNPGHTPIFQVFFNFVEDPLPSRNVAGAAFAPVDVDGRTAKTDLTLHLVRTADGLAGWLEYSADLFHAERMERMAGHFETLLRSVAANPDGRISTLPMLPERESRQMLVEWNATGREYFKETTLAQLFETQAARTPDAIALVDGEQRLTYRELNARANQLAHYLKAQGVGPEVLVGICVERSWRMLAAVLGVLKAGGAYVPMDPAFPAGRVAFILDDTKAPLLLTQESLRGLAAQSAARVICLESDWPLIAAQSRENPSGEINERHLAYVLYTSGSTGRPKGVAIEHRSAVALMGWAHDVFTAREISGVLASTSLCFDLSVFELFVPLSWGGKVILAENVFALPELAAAKEVTLLNTVPSAMREVLRAQGVPTSVRVVNLAGEPLGPQLVDQIYAETSARKVYDLYGPTETTTYSTFTLREAGEPATIGRPLANQQVYVLDARLQPVPVGVPGELHIGGDGLARGYLNRPDLTARKFIPHPFKSGERLYRTGDLARWRADGNLELLGRIDQQIKIRGFRVEPAEIESMLRQHPRVHDAVVVARKTGQGDAQLIGYVVGDAEHCPEAAELRKFARENLPEYMVPAAIVFLETLPRTPGGKIERVALPESAEERPAHREFVAPRTPMEAAVAAIWREVLGREQIDVRENFFDLGGHSFLAIRVISRVREVFRVELPLFSLFDAPTIESLAVGLGSGIWTQNQIAIPPMQPQPRGAGIIPASFMQAGLWFIDQLEPGGVTYNVPTVVRLKGKLDGAVLRRALDEMVRRHEALRTTFDYAERKIVQVIAVPEPAALTTSDLSGLPREEAAERAMELARAEIRKPFDLARGPLARFALVQIAPDEHLFVTVMHHAICDGWSVAVFFNELQVFYNAELSGQPAGLPDLPIQYADFAYWQQQWMQGAALEREVSFWKSKLVGAPPALTLPGDRTEPPVPTRRSARAYIDLPKELVQAMGAMTQRNGGTPFMVLMAALALTLHKWTAQRDMVIGTVVAGRNRREIENVLGCFMNFLPIRLKFGGSATGRELLEQVKATVLEAQAHQDCPFEKMVEATNPERGQLQNPLYNVTLLLQNFSRIAFDATGVEAEFVPMEPDATPVDLEFEAQETEKGMTVKCEFRTDLFDTETIHHLLTSYHDIVQGLVERAETPLTELSISPALHRQAETHQPVRPQKLAIAATFTAEPVDEFLRHWMTELELPLQIEFAPYNQVFQQLLDPSSVLATNTAGMNVVLLRLEDWLHSGENARGSMAGERGVLERNVREFVAAVRAAAGRSSVPWLICCCPPSTGAAQDATKAVLLSRQERALASELESAGGVYVVTAAELAGLYPVRDYYDASGDEMGNVPYTPAFFAALGTIIARKYHALNRPAHKVIVLDCDQTLWGGVCGEDGPHGIRIEPPWKALQEFMRAQHSAGWLLAMCSKNNEEDVREVFAQRLDMPLRREHFAAARLNWLPKSENIRSLAAELNLGLDSFIFLDDNPVECAEVGANCPEVLTLQLPAEPERIPEFLKHCWAFDRLKLTEEDRRRTEMYRQNREREALRSQSMSLADFLKGLDLKIEIGPMSEEQLPRVAQLTQRTNQFNFTTRRRTEADLRLLREHAEIFTVCVRDRFGDYGLVGVMICAAKEGALEVDTLLLSCRVLGRGVEYAMIARLGQVAQERGVPWLDAHFQPSPKNKPALDFLEAVGSHYKQPLNGGYLFRFPAEIAAGMTFNPRQDAPPDSRDERARESRPAPADAPRRGRFTQCLAIAMNGGDMDRIVRAIEEKTVSRAARQGGYAAPQTDMERKLCALWERLLRIERVGIRDNFFELGGHSLLAVRLFAEVEKLIGRKFPLVTVFQAPTIEQLARVFSNSADAASRSPIVPIQPNGSRPPLFLVHGAGGDVLWGYANLARHMHADQPIYGIKSRGQVGLEEYERLDDMAAYYLDELRAQQPHGPYYLGGYCLGGNVAYEMARQLREQGERVGMVALLDASPSNAGYEQVTWWRLGYPIAFARNLGYWLFDFIRLPLAEQRMYVLRKLRFFGRKVLGRLRRRNGPEPIDLEEVIELSFFPENELRLWEIHLRALVEHVQRPYEGRVTLFRTRGQPLFCSLEEDFCWNKLVKGGVIVKRIPGSHENIFMEPNVKFLARELELALAEAQSAMGTQTRELQRV